MTALGLIGFGDHAQNVLVPVLENLREIQLVAIADPDLDRQAQAHRRVPAASIFSGYDQLLDLEELDAVIICPPPAMHAPAAIAALQKKKSIYLEKPLALNLHQAQRVIEVWKETGVVGMIGFNYRFHPLYQAARQLIRSLAVGELRYARTNFSTRSKKISSWRQSLAGGGGALLDLGSHHFDLMRYLFGQEIVSVCARTQSILSEADQTVMEMQLETGPIIQSVFSFRSIEEERVEIYTAAGKWTADHFLGDQLEFSNSSQHWARGHRAAHAVRAFGRSLYTQVAAPGPRLNPSYRIALMQFIAAVREGQPVQPDLQDGLESLRVAQAAIFSAQNGAAVSPQALDEMVSA